MKQKMKVKNNRAFSIQTILAILAVMSFLLACDMPSPDPDPNPDPGTMEPMVPTINEAPNLGTARTFTVLDTIDSASPIGTLAASDPENRSLTYRIVQNSPTNENGLFEFADSASGALSLRSGVSLSISTPQHRIIVQVSNGALTATGLVTINVVDRFVSANISQSGNLNDGLRITLSGSESRAVGPAPSFLWELTDPATAPEGVRILAPTNEITQVALPYLPVIGDTLNLTFRLTVTSGENSATESETYTITARADSDGDGLIEIRDLTMLHNMRHSLSGATYATSASDTGTNSGCPTDDMGTADTSDDVTACFGYELIYDLNFDTNDTDTLSDTVFPTWTDNEDGTFSIDTDDSQAPYFVVADNGTGGWQAIGTRANRFSGVFDGNGYSIHNLAIHEANTGDVAFISFTSSSASIQNVHLVNALVVSGSFSSILVGSSAGTVSSSSSSGVLSTPANNGSAGLIASSSSLNTALYTSARVFSGPSGNSGLIANLEANSVLQASYATGSVTLAVRIDNGFSASLVGEADQARIIASYATGNTVLTGTGTPNILGNLLGSNSGSTITQSFGFGTPDNMLGTSLPTIADGNGGTRPINPAELTLERANGETRVWNSPSNNTLGAWDFSRRATGGGPSLRYADYDGEGNRFYCAGESEPAYDSATEPRPIRIARCGEHLPQQFAPTN